MSVFIPFSLSEQLDRILLVLLVVVPQKLLPEQGVRGLGGILLEDLRFDLLLLLLLGHVRGHLEAAQVLVEALGFIFVVALRHLLVPVQQLLHRVVIVVDLVLLVVVI